MENETFHADVDKMFESYLGAKETPVIRIMKDGKIITKKIYGKVLFDADLNIYKRLPEGGLEQITDPAFKAVVVKLS